MNKIRRRHCLMKAARYRKIWKFVEGYMREGQNQLIELCNRPYRPLFLELPKDANFEGAPL